MHTATGVLRLFNWIGLVVIVLGLLVSYGHNVPLFVFGDPCPEHEQWTTIEAALERRHVPLFVFGDSLVDVGNNKFVPMSIVRADYLPNGVDFVNGPTGRFSNGRTVLDVLCDIIGLPYPPAALDPNTALLDILQEGVIYGSAAAGILDHTGDQLGRHLSMNRQIEYFNATVVELNSRFGSAQTAKFLAKVVGLTVIGSNDFINNYWSYLSFFTRLAYTPTQFNGLLLHYFGEQLTTIYNLGLRKIWVFGVPPLGNIPFSLHEAANVVDNFTDKINAHVEEFNIRGLQYGLLPQLARRLPGVIFLYSDTYNVFNDIRENAGFKEFNNACCHGTFCFPWASFCADRNEHAFWDAFHPTEAMNVLLANQIINRGGPMFTGTSVSLVNLAEFINLA